jgi:hypothetical protein
MMEGSGAGSGRPKNIRIRILNTDSKATFLLFVVIEIYGIKGYHYFRNKEMLGTINAWK